MDSLLEDLHDGYRALRDTPGTIVVAAVTLLALVFCIAANPAMLRMAQGVLVQPLPFRDPGRLYTLWERQGKLSFKQYAPAVDAFLGWREHNTVFEGLGAFDTSRTFNLAAGEGPERVVGTAVTPGLFELLGVKPLMGRTFTTEEGEAGRDRVVILSYRLWQRRFDGHRLIVGKTIKIDGKNHTVIGVMPRGFRLPGNSGGMLNIFADAPAQLWVPLALEPGSGSLRSSHNLRVIARLKDTVTLGQAQGEMNAIEERIVRDNPRDYVGSAVKIVPLQSRVASSTPLSAAIGLIAANTEGTLLPPQPFMRPRDRAIPPRAALPAPSRATPLPHASAASSPDSL